MSYTIFKKKTHLFPTPLWLCVTCLGRTTMYKDHKINLCHRIRNKRKGTGLKTQDMGHQLAELAEVCVCVCVSTYRARNRFSEAHAELMTEDVQQEAFTFLQRGEESALVALHTSQGGLWTCGGCTDPLVLWTQLLLSFDFLAVVTVLYLGGGQAPAKRTKKVAPEKEKIPEDIMMSFTFTLENQVQLKAKWRVNEWCPTILQLAWRIGPLERACCFSSGTIFWQSPLLLL